MPEKKQNTPPPKSHKPRGNTELNITNLNYDSNLSMLASV